MGELATLIRDLTRELPDALRKHDVPGLTTSSRTVTRHMQWRRGTRVGSDSGGAGYVTLADGSPAVVTRSFASLRVLELTQQVMLVARAHGVPTPRHYSLCPLPDGSTAMVQERMPGPRPPWTRHSATASLR